MKENIHKSYISNVTVSYFKSSTTLINHQQSEKTKFFSRKKNQHSACKLSIKPLNVSLNIRNK